MSASDTQSLPRPGLRPLRKRPSMLKQLWADIPILVLAAILSGYMWYSNRQEILVEGEDALIQDVAVKLRDVPERLRVTPSTLDPIDLQFAPMTKGQFDRIKRELTENGLTLVLGRAPTGESRGFSKARGDRYEFDWAGLLEDADNWPWFPPGQITSLERFSPRVERPVLPDLSDAGIEVEYLDTIPDAQEFRGGSTVYRPDEPETLYPDRIERAQLLEYVSGETFEEVVKIPCGFGTWRRGGDPTQPLNASDPVRPERKDVELETTYVELRLRRAGTKAITNELRLAVTIAEADAYTFEIQDKVATNVGPGGADVTATVVGTAAEIEKLEQNLDQWYFLISIRPEERSQLQRVEGEQQASVQVQLSIVLPEGLREELSRVRIRPTQGQDDAFFLSVRKRSPP